MKNSEPDSLEAATWGFFPTLGLIVLPYGGFALSAPFVGGGIGIDIAGLFAYSLGIAFYIIDTNRESPWINFRNKVYGPALLFCYILAIFGFGMRLVVDVKYRGLKF